MNFKVDGKKGAVFPPKPGLTGISIKQDEKLKKLVAEASSAIVATVEDRVGRYGFVYAMAMERVPGTSNFDFFHSMQAGQAGLETLSIVANALRQEADRLDQIVQDAAKQMLGQQRPKIEEDSGDAIV